MPGAMPVNYKPSSPVSEPVLSPCVSICALDDNDVCVGCFRTGSEISHWGALSSHQQREILGRCALRMAGGEAACVVASVKAGSLNE